MIKRLSATGIKCFKACRRAYQLKYVYGLTPVQTSDALETGTQYHKLIEEFYKDGTVPECVDKASAMALAYIKYVAPKVPAYEPEVSFDVSLARGKRLQGRLDGWIADSKIIIEHKTTSFDVDEFEYRLQFDEQLLAYFVAMGCNTAWYTVCKKPTIRQRQNEPLEEYAFRCLAWYDIDYTNKINGIKIEATAADIQQYKLQLLGMFSQIQQAEKHPDTYFYCNPGNCNAYNRLCEYASICKNYDPNQTYINFERREA